MIVEGEEDILIL